MNKCKDMLHVVYDLNNFALHKISSIIGKLFSLILAETVCNCVKSPINTSV